MKQYLPIIIITVVTAILISVITKMLGAKSNLSMFASLTILPILYFITQKK